MSGKLYLIPNLLGESRIENVLPAEVVQIIKGLQYFIVEDIRTSRRFISKIGSNYPLDSLIFFPLNEHTSSNEITSYLDPLAQHDMGILSDAGVPGVADPGAEIVRLAHIKGIKVIPLVGPSSILLAVMASGLNGQNFAFNGYLPAKKSERIQRIRFYEKRALYENQSQVFIETPYRNMQLLEDILATCQPGTLLGIAADITLSSELICTMSIHAWKKKLPALHKRPAIFIIGK